MLAGLVVGLAFPRVGVVLEIALWPVLALLLYTTFTQVPLTHLRAAFANSRFLGAAIAGNFIAMPPRFDALIYAREHTF
jgi:arsenite transporter